MILAFNICPIQGPCRVLAIAKCFIEVVFFIFQQLFVGTDCPSPVFKGVDNTLLGRQVMVNVPLLQTMKQKSGVIYRYNCCWVDCEEQYIGESGRTFAERFRQYMRAPSPIHDHFNIIGHKVSLNNFSIVVREDQSIARAIKEAMLISINGPSLNRNIGKYQLPHIWDEVLVKSPELKLK